MTQEQAIQLFEEKRVRTVWDTDAEKWWFSIIDCIAVLTDSPDPRNYWKVLKHRLKAEGNETVTNCNRLKMLHQSFVTAISMELSLWSWTTTLPISASTIGFTDIRTEISMPRLATHRFFQISWVMSPTESISETALVQGGTLKFRAIVIRQICRLEK